MISELTLQEKIVAFLFGPDVSKSRSYLDQLIVQGLPIDVFKTPISDKNGIRYIDTPVSKLIDLAREFYRQQRQVLTKDVLIEELKRRRKPQEEIQAYESLFLKIREFVLVGQDFGYYCRRLQEVSDKNSILAAYNESMGSLEVGDVAEAYSILRNRVLQLEKTKSTSTKTVDLSSVVDEEWSTYQSIKADPDSLRGIPTGWKEMDDWTFGLHPGELWLIAARTAVGKSIALGNVAMHNYIQGRNVVIATREMPIQQIRRRFAAAEAFVDYNRLKRGSLDPEEEKRYYDVIQARKLKGNKLFIIPQDRCVDTMSLDIELRRILEDFPVSLLVVDYLNIVKPCGIPLTAPRDSLQGQIALELRDLAISYKIPVLSAVQDNRSAVTDVEDKGTETIAMSDEIGRNADSILRLYRTPSDKANGSITARFIKSRDFDPREFTLRADFSKMLISDSISNDLGI